MDKHLLLLSSAIQGSFSGEQIDEKKLSKNVADCFARIKKVCEEDDLGDNEYVSFRVNSCVVLMLACKSVRETTNLFNSDEFLPILNSYPTLEESTYLTVTRSMKNYRYMFSTLVWFPSDVILNVCLSFGKCCSNPTPVTLAMSEQLMKTLLFTLQHEDNPSLNYNEALEVFITFYKAKLISTESNTSIKLGGYIFMYLTKCISYLSKSIARQDIEKPDDASGLALMIKNKWTKHPSNAPDLTVPMFAIREFLKIGISNVKNISVDTWMSWCTINLPVTITPKQGMGWNQSNTLPPKANNIQESIAHDAFYITNCFMDNIEMFADLKTEFKDVFEFYQQVSSDPNHDPDSDLSIEQLIADINIKDNRTQKLLSLLLDKEDIFQSKAIQECVFDNTNYVSPSTCLSVLNRFLDIDKNTIYDQWLETTLNLAANIPSCELMKIIETRLNCGLDDQLKSSSFENHMTSVFNQLASDDQSNTAARSEKDQITWLCLQSGKDVVKLAINISVSLPGLDGVIVKALSIIPCISLATDPDTGNSVLVTSLHERYKNGMSAKENKEFLSLISGLLKENSRVAVICPEELINVFVFPNLAYDSSSDMALLITPLTILQDVFVTSKNILSSGPELASLLITLLNIINSTRQLDISSNEINLSIRELCTSTLNLLMNSNENLNEVCKRDFSYVKQELYENNIHPRCVCPYLPVFESQARINSELSVEIYESIYSNKIVDTSLIKSLKKDFDKTDWIWFLFQELPHSNKQEWTSAVIVTEALFQLEEKITELLKVFHQVLVLSCLYFNSLKTKSLTEAAVGSICKENGDKCNTETNDTETEDENPLMKTKSDSDNVKISVEHCFKTFSSSISVYVTSKLKNKKLRERVKFISTIICWWCRHLDCLDCNETWPLLLIGRLIDDLQDILQINKARNEQNKDTSKAEAQVPERDTIVESELRNISINIIKHVPVCNYSSAFIRKYLHILN